jgi:hypothetical protein
MTLFVRRGVTLRTMVARDTTRPLGLIADGPGSARKNALGIEPGTGSSLTAIVWMSNGIAGTRIAR